MITRVALLDGETLYEMWAEGIPYPPREWAELHALDQAPWTGLAAKLIDMDTVAVDSWCEECGRKHLMRGQVEPCLGCGGNRFVFRNPAAGETTP